ncbi:MAG TPA: alkaline phosphatase family protein [Streptosporangiaceae bacterium]
MGQGLSFWRSKSTWRNPYVIAGAAVVLGASLTVSTVSMASTRAPANTPGSVPVPKTVPASAYLTPHTATPIKHVVVIFDENVSFDHYFGTYPNAANTDGSPFHAKKGTPTVNGLTPALLSSNPNSFNPQRLTPSEALTCDQNHSYGPEQQAADGGKMDKFVQFTDHDTCTGQPILFGQPGLVMDYYDGNTVTGLWNYAQHYAMSDNMYDTNYGPSTPGAVNVMSGNDSGAMAVNPTTGAPVSDPGAIGSVNSQGLGTLFGDIDPAFDQCSDNSHTSTNPVGVLTGKNIGDLLNAKHITWGWFQGGFAPTGTGSNGNAICGATHNNIGGIPVSDYVPHHEPFQLYASTANPAHLPPTSEKEIGRTDQANHQYDITDFFQTLKKGNMPAVSFLKPPAYQNGHAANSDPLDEQHFLVNTINQIELSKDWKSTAIIVTYDDSDGWYDHQSSPTVNGSNDPAQDQAQCMAASISLGNFNDRCGYGPRLPFLVISPWAKQNFVGHKVLDQSSVITFIEDNWLKGKQIGHGSFDEVAGSIDGPGGLFNFRQRPNDKALLLDSVTGEVIGKVKSHKHHGK